MSILTEEEREDVYKCWLQSSTLINEDGLIQLAERVVLEKLTAIELPQPAMRELNPYLGGGNDPYNGKAHLEWFTADQLRQAYAQGAASQLSAEPVGEILGHDVKRFNTFSPVEYIEHGTKLYTLKEPK